jgi:hypothetical protein
LYYEKKRAMRMSELPVRELSRGIKTASIVKYTVVSCSLSPSFGNVYTPTGIINYSMFSPANGRSVYWILKSK